LYESDFARALLGDSFHPGGLKLTERLGQLLQLSEKSRVLDVASGRGTTAVFLAERFGCGVLGIDYSRQNVEEAARAATAKGLSSRVRFQEADSESLPLPEGAFDAVICECAFCTFPEKKTVAREFARVLRDGGMVGISDLTRGPDLPKELDGLLSWIACIADAQPLDGYVNYLRSAGLSVEATESHDGSLQELVRQIQGKLLGAEIVAGLKQIELPGTDIASARQMATAAASAIRQGQLGYAMVIACKPKPSSW
jgi:ubiquinone/menaquinone biosynthesis C-methylase UbiE